MNISEWYNTLCQREDVRTLIPMEWQPAPPKPFLRQGKLWLYVPCQRIWAEEGRILCSVKLGELWFCGAERSIVKFINWQQVENADPRQRLAECEMDDAEMYRRNLTLERYLMELERMEKAVARDQKLTTGQMEAYWKLLQEALIMPGQSELYEEVEA